MSPWRLLLLVLGPALAVEAAIFYVLLGLGAGGDLVVCVEMIWLAIAAGIGGLLAGRLDH